MNNETFFIGEIISSNHFYIGLQPSAKLNIVVSASAMQSSNIFWHQ
jgi:hypothetical protein